MDKLEDKFYIVNTDDQFGRGYHWVLLFNCNDGYIIYFDSFGVPPLKEIENIMHQSNKQGIYNIYRIRLDSKLCGVLCIYVADQLLKGDRTYYDILTDFSNSNHLLNESFNNI